jgi:hypothetical protein
MPLSTIFQLYRGGPFLFVEETRVPRDNHQPAVEYVKMLKEAKNNVQQQRTNI